MDKDKAFRVDEANRVIQIISNHGRRFFWSARYERRARFEVDLRGRVWLIDDHTGKRIYTHYARAWNGFSHGGTLRALCEALRDYIRTGEPLARGWFGPWPDNLCRGDLWGYGKDMEKVRQGVFQTKAVEASGM